MAESFFSTVKSELADRFGVDHERPNLRKIRRKSRCRGPVWMGLEETVVPVGGLEPPTLRL